MQKQQSLLNHFIVAAIIAAGLFGNQISFSAGQEYAINFDGLSPQEALSHVVVSIEGLIVEVNDWTEDLLTSSKKFETLVAEFNSLCKRFDDSVTTPVNQLKEIHKSDVLVQGTAAFVSDVSNVIKIKLQKALQDLLIASKALAGQPVKRVALFKKEFTAMAANVKNDFLQLHKKLVNLLAGATEAPLKAELSKLGNTLSKLSTRYGNEKTITDQLQKRVLFNFARE